MQRHLKARRTGWIVQNRRRRTQRQSVHRRPLRINHQTRGRRGPRTTVAVRITHRIRNLIAARRSVLSDREAPAILQRISTLTQRHRHWESSTRRNQTEERQAIKRFTHTHINIHNPRAESPANQVRRIPRRKDNRSKRRCQTVTHR